MRYLVDQSVHLGTARQPNLVQRLITTPKRCNLEQFRKLGKACYDADKAEKPAAYQEIYTSMSNNQKSVFWDAYNHRKRELVGKIPLGETFKALITRIQRSRKIDLPRPKAHLVRLQKGQIKVREPPKNEDGKQRDSSGAEEKQSPISQSSTK